MDRTNIQQDAKTITVENSKMFGGEQENRAWFDARKMLLGITDSGSDPRKIDLTKINNDKWQGPASKARSGGYKKRDIQTNRHKETVNTEAPLIVGTTPW